MSLAERQDSLSLRQKQQIDEVCLAFEDSWLVADRPLLEPWLERVDSVIRPALLKELLLIEFEYRQAVGESVDLQHYLDRFPGMETVVRAAYKIAAEREIPLRFLAGHQLGRYEVKKRIGAGAFAAVYLAWDPRLQRDVAVKVPHRCRSLASESRARMLEEARAVAKLKHPGIVSVYDAQLLDDGTLFLVMQYVAGTSLEQRLQKGPLPPPQAVQIAIEVAEAVGAAHRQGVVHRDLKPSNVLMDDQGHAHVADFGLALLESEQHLRAGEYAGTLAYMAPEQLRAKTEQMDGRADIWAIGVVLYEMLAGRLPFRQQRREQLAEEVLARDPKPLRQINPAIPRSLQQVCSRCMRVRPADRYGATVDLVKDLRRWESGTSRRQMSVAFAGVILLAAMLAVASFVPRAPGSLAPTMLPPLTGSVDLLVWSSSDPDRQADRLGAGSTRPVRPGDRIRIQARLNRPAFMYLLWLDCQAEVLPIFPWRAGKWNDISADQQTRMTLALPQTQNEAWTMDNGPGGMETLLLLARSTPLPHDVDLKNLSRDVPAARVPLREQIVWSEGGQRRAEQRNKTRKPVLGRRDVLDDPLLNLHWQLAKVLRPHFDLVHAVSFPVSRR